MTPVMAASDEDAAHGPGDATTPTAHREASVILVNTCGFIEAAKQDSIGELLSAAESGVPVVAAGCLAERYGAELAEALPEAEVISFDDYPAIGGVLDRVLAGERRPAHTPRDRRRLLPLAPAERPAAERAAATGPGHGPRISGQDRTAREPARRAQRRRHGAAVPCTAQRARFAAAVSRTAAAARSRALPPAARA